MGANTQPCPCTGVTLDKLVQPAALMLLARGPMHGYRILRGLAELYVCGQQGPHATGVYRSLKLMEDRGLVVSTWATSDTGPAKRLFELTDEGRKCLDQWVRTLEDYSRGVSQLLRMMRQASRASETRPCRCRHRKH